MTTTGLAADTCARRLRDLEAQGSPLDVDWGISWYGPADFAPDHPGNEAMVQALCGLMEVNGRDEGTPRRLGLEVASVAAGLLATQGALAAAVAETRGRPVGAVRTSALQAGLILLSHYFMVATCLGDVVPGPPLPAPGPPFRSADGHRFEIETLDPEAWKQLWTRLGAGAADLGRGWTQFRWRYERAACSLPPGLHEAAARHSLGQLVDACDASGVSLSPLRSYADVLADPVIGTDRPDVERWPREQARAGADVPTTSRAAKAPAGCLGSNDELPLGGVRVVEATSRIQGPFAGMLLRMLGADVVRVQPPEGDYGRAAVTLHREKEIVQLDLGTPSGRADLSELVGDADVFLHNWRPGKAADWDLGPHRLASRHPGLVYAQACGWDNRGDERRILGTDFLVQAYTALGDGLTPEEEPAAPSRMILCDLFGALVGTEGVLAGLYRRELAGGSWLVGSSLLSGAMSLQAHVLRALKSGQENGRRAGRPVWRTLDKPVATADGALVIAAEEDDTFDRLCRACDVDPSGSSRDAAELRLAATLAGGSSRDWQARLCAAGVPYAVVATDLAAVATDARLSALFEPVADGGLVPRSPWSFR